MQDEQIYNGLKNNSEELRSRYEKELYLQYKYFIDEGCRKWRMAYDDSFSAYSDAVLAAIHNIVSGRFDGRVSLKTYLFQIFHNKSVDLIRKVSNNKQKVNRSAIEPELLSFLPDGAKVAVERMIALEEIEQMKRYFEQIGEKCRELLLLFEDGFSDREIAEKLRYSNALVVKTARSRCREKIKNIIKPE